MANGFFFFNDLIAKIIGKCISNVESKLYLNWVSRIKKYVFFMSAQWLAHKLVCNKCLLNECAKESNAIIDDSVDMFNSRPWVELHMYYLNIL